MKIASIKEKYSELSLPVKASLWYTVCNVINKAIALFATPIFTRIMTEEEYGTFAVFQSWYSILIIFTSLNVFLGGYQKGLILYKDDISRFTAAQLGLTTTITILFLAIYLLNIPFWTGVFDLEPILMFAMIAELLLMPALELWSSQQRFDYKYKKYVGITMAMSLLTVLGGAIAVLSSNHKVGARVFSDAVAKGIFSGTLFILIFLSGKCFYNREYWKYSLSFNLPLIPHYLSNYVLSQSDRVMIGQMVGNSQAAYYSVAYTISTVMVLITSAINNSLTPYIYKSIASGDKKGIKSTTRVLVILVAGLCVVTMTFAPEVIRVFAGEKYMDAIYVIPPVAASVFFIFLYSLFSTIEYYYQKTGFIAIATCICAVANLILNYIFINMYGYYAAGYTTVVCYIGLAYLHYFFYRKVSKEEDCGNTYDGKLCVILSVTVLAVMLIMALTYQYSWVRYGFFVLVIAVAAIFRNKIKDAIVSFRK